MKMEFTTFDIVKLFNIPRSNVQQYIDRGLLTPSFERTQGRGSKNRFSFNDLYRFNLFQKLYVVGLSQREASENSCLVDFRKIADEGDSWLRVVRDKSKIKIVFTNEEAIKSELHSADIFIALNIQRIKEEVDALAS